MAAGKNDAAHAMLVQQGDEVGDGMALQIEFADDLHQHQLLRREGVAKLMHVLDGAGQEDRFAQVFAARA